MTDEPLSHNSFYPSMKPLVEDEPKVISDEMARWYPSMKPGEPVAKKPVEAKPATKPVAKKPAEAAPKTEAEPAVKPGEDVLSRAGAKLYPSMAKPEAEPAKPEVKPAETKPAKAEDMTSRQEDEPVEIAPEVQQQVTSVQEQFTAPQLDTYLDTLDAAVADDPGLIDDLRAQAEKRGGTLEQLLVDPAFIKHALALKET